MPYIYALYEHAMGYAFFKTIKVSDMACFRRLVMSKVARLSRFQEIVSFLDIKLFKNNNEALEALNHLAEGVLHPELRTYIENWIPKKTKSIIGVSDPKLATAISEMGYNCSTDDAVHELLRGIRLYFCDIADALDAATALKSELGLSHCHSRAVTKFNVYENLIRQNVTILNQLEKDIKKFTKNIREMYQLHFPELQEVVPEDIEFVKCVNIVRNRHEIAEVQQELEDVLKDPMKIEKISSLARISRGLDIDSLDITNAFNSVDLVMSMVKKRDDTLDYIKSNMQQLAPNLTALLGEVTGARLIAKAGSLEKLATSPASSLQILGANKGVLNAYKIQGGVPQFGVLFNSQFSSNAAYVDKGRISRYLANKCAVACRIDFFSDTPTQVFGGKLKNQVESRIHFLETGEDHLSNVKVMSEAVDEAEIETCRILKAKRKALKKLKKRKRLRLDLPKENETLTQVNEEIEL